MKRHFLHISTGTKMLSGLSIQLADMMQKSCLLRAVSFTSTKSSGKCARQFQTSSSALFLGRKSLFANYHHTRAYLINAKSDFLPSYGGEPKKANVDEADAKIIHLLNQNARISNSELGKTINLNY